MIDAVHLLAQAIPSPSPFAPPPTGPDAPIPTPVLVFNPVIPELVLCAMAIVGMLYEAFARRSLRQVHLVIALAGLAVAGIAALKLWNWTGDPTVLGDSIAADRFTVLATLILVIAAAFGVIAYTHEAASGRLAFRGEFYPLVLFATAGMVLIAAANDLIVVFIALEILSLSLYVLTGLGGSRSNEAAMKYFLLGAFSSAFFLYGVAMAYGATATTKIPAIVGALAGQTGSQALALLALGLLVIGFGFKIAAAPFHMWTPDVYQGAPTPVVAFMSAGTKVAAFFALMRVLDVALQPLTTTWTPVIYALAIVSVVLGAVLAAAQRDVKRMLGYSAVAHAGFILAGLTSPNMIGIRAAMFYLIAYSVMTVGAFGIVMLVGVKTDEPSSYDNYDGLAQRSPGLAALLTIFLLSLAGIPPTVGFIAKLTVFGSAIQAGNWPLVIVCVLASVIAAYAYLRVVLRMYFRAPHVAVDDDRSLMPQVAGLVLAVTVLVLGVFPRLLSSVIESASILKW
jgi:NADH-quinone oxidoreductase subunit N